MCIPRSFLAEAAGAVAQAQQVCFGYRTISNRLRPPKYKEEAPLDIDIFDTCAPSAALFR